MPTSEQGILSALPSRDKRQSREPENQNGTRKSDSRPTIASHRQRQTPRLWQRWNGSEASQVTAAGNSYSIAGDAESKRNNRSFRQASRFTGARLGIPGAQRRSLTATPRKARLRCEIRHDEMINIRKKPAVREKNGRRPTITHKRGPRRKVSSSPRTRGPEKAPALQGC